MHEKMLSLKMSLSCYKKSSKVSFARYAYTFFSALAFLECYLHNILSYALETLINGISFKFNLKMKWYSFRKFVTEHILKNVI